MYFRAFTVNRKENRGRPDVGYAKTDKMNDVGATLLTPIFAKVGTSTGNPRFGDFIPVRKDGLPIEDYKIEVQGLFSDGTTDWDFNFTWENGRWIDYNDFSEDPDASDVEITQGRGLWIYNTTEAEVYFQGAGQVSEFDAEYPMNDVGATAIGNCYPVETTWGQVVPIRDDGKPIEDYKIEVQGLNYDGTTDWDYNYTWENGRWIDYNDFSEDPDATNVKIPVGKGLWVYNTTEAKVTIHIAAPEL